MPSIALPVSLRGQLLSGSRFNPISLFSAGEQGIWLDPSDLTTMFQDRAGTTPVTTPGQTVGLRLDKSKGLTLGSELITNGDFSGGSTGWSTQAGWAISGGTANATTVAAANVSQLGILTVGKYYKISFTISNFTAGFGAILVITPNFVNVLGNGTYTVQGFANSTAFQVYAGPNSSFSVDNISVKELAGNHATAPTDAARPTYGIEPWSGRRNLLTRTEEFGDAAWTKANLTVSANAGVAPDGTTTADRLVESAANIGRGTYFTSTTTVSGNTTWSVYLKAAERNFGGLTAIDGGNNRYYLVANLTNGAEIASGSAAGSPSLVSKSITSVGNGWYRLQITLNSVSGATNFGWVYPQDDATFATESTGNAIYQGDGTSGILIWGAQLELGSTATAYQRVGTAFDVTEAGVATVHYVQYDGTDDSFSTSSIDFSATDKMSVFAGARKSSDAASGILVELSANAGGNNGSFYVVTGPDPFAANRYSSSTRGSLSITASNTATTNIGNAPDQAVLSSTHDISGDLTTIRRNGVLGTSATVDLGLGNFGNHPLFIGRRNNATVPFNGRDYGIIVVGKTASATEITNTESYLAANTSGVTL